MTTETKKKPEVVAETKEEKQLLEEKKTKKEAIDKLHAKNTELESEAIRFENLASTLTFEPFVELKMLVSNAIQDGAKKQNIKDIKINTKSFEAIDLMEALLKDYEDKAKDNRADIILNNKMIDDYEVKIEEISGKLKNFQLKIV